MKKLFVVAIALIASINCFSQSEYGTTAEWNQFNKKNPSKEDYIKLFQRVENLERTLITLNSTMVNFTKSYQDKVDSLYQNNLRLLTQINYMVIAMNNVESKPVPQVTTSSYSNQPQIHHESVVTSHRVTQSTAPKTNVSYGRCKATTKKGTQCSRSGTSSGYCWQHG